MPKSRPPYSPEYRRKIVALVRAGRNPNELAREFECSAQTVWPCPNFPDASSNPLSVARIALD